MEESIQPVIECLKAMQEASEQLREALIRGRVEEIQTQVTEHERLAERLQTLMAARPTNVESGPGVERGTIRDLVDGIRRIHRTNHAMASVFCETVNRTIHRFCSAGVAHAGTYGANGIVTERVASVLVHQEG